MKNDEDNDDFDNDYHDDAYDEENYFLRALYQDASFEGSPDTKSDFFSLIMKISFEWHNQNLWRNPCRFKTWKEFYDEYWYS